MQHGMLETEQRNEYHSIAWRDGQRQFEVFIEDEENEHVFFEKCDSMDLKVRQYWPGNQP